jgi:putative DNA methylase
MRDDKRLIEDYLPIREISAEASREKSVRKGHISTLHLWWARRPLVACRAAVYGALVPATQFQPVNGPEEKRASLGRANAHKFITRLCKYPGDPEVIKQAQRHILEAHAARLTAEDAENAKKEGREPRTITVQDIEAGRAPRPKVLDMFAGGGSIPLEALRLGCEAYALELNPVAHIVELCTLVYPQKYGRPDTNARGVTGPPGADGKPTWGGLAKEVEYWGKWVLERVRREIGDLYPPIPDPDYRGKRPEIEFRDGAWIVRSAKGGKVESESPQQSLAEVGLPRAQRSSGAATPSGYLTPVAYLWTRTVKCKNPNCGATVPLVRQTWLCKKPKRYVALNMIAPKGEKQVHFEVVEAASEKGLGFDPAAFSKGGNATCAFCGTVADDDHVKNEGCAGKLVAQPMGIVATRQERQGRVYLAADSLDPLLIPDQASIRGRIQEVSAKTGLTVPREPLTNDAKGSCWCTLYGLTTFSDLFTPRQMVCLLAVGAGIRAAESVMRERGVPQDRSVAIMTHLAIYLDRAADHWSSLCTWNPSGEKLQHTFVRQALPMVWDFAEANPFGGSVGDWTAIVANAEHGIWAGTSSGTLPAVVRRGTAVDLPWPDTHFDAVITDPPYYDNVPYANIADFFYVWLRRTIAHLYPEHFAGEGNPKKSEIVADASRHSDNKERARHSYESMMAKAFAQANRVLKPGGQMTVVYAHKTTVGWSTLVDALRQADFTVMEAWPLDTELRTRLRSMASSALASSIFLVARKRDGAGAGSYEREVRPELESIVRERVDTLWKMGISGADLVIAAVGAGLRAYTQFERVAYENGEEVPAERFLCEVEGVVLDTLLERIFGVSKSGVSAVDAPTRFYVLWRFTYRQAEIDAGEVIVFAYPQHVELDGPRSLTYGARPLLQKTKSKYQLKGFTERGDDDRLGLPTDPSAGSGQGGMPAPLIDVLHRVLWLMENRPAKLYEFLGQAVPDTERLRLVAQALAGPALEGGADLGIARNPEQAALRKLTTNWRSLIEENLFQRRT